jgi:hypothetical protein
MQSYSHAYLTHDVIGRNIDIIVARIFQKIVMNNIRNKQQQ